MNSLLCRILALALALARVHGMLRTHENKHDGDDKQQCSLSSLKGSSVYAVTGWTVVDEGSTNVYRYPQASAGKEIYDGEGGLLAVGTVNSNGKVGNQPCKEREPPFTAFLLIGILDRENFKCGHLYRKSRMLGLRKVPQ